MIINSNTEKKQFSKNLLKIDFFQYLTLLLQLFEKTILNIYI